MQEKIKRYRTAIAAIKIATGTVEISSAVFLLLIGRDLLDRWSLKVGKALAYPSAHIGDLAAKTVHHAADHKLTLAIGLLALGSAKVVGGIGFLFHKPWGYYLLVIVLVAYIPYDGYDMSHHVGPFAVSTLLIDLAIIFLLLRHRQAFLHE